MRFLEAGELIDSKVGGVWCLILPTRRFLNKDLNAGDELPGLVVLVVFVLFVLFGMFIGAVEAEEMEWDDAEVVNWLDCCCRVSNCCCI